MDAVVAENLTVVYERVRALEDVSFRIPRGSMTAVIGPTARAKARCSRHA
jgi:ABC-type multidrug transport system ATPase subunit